MGRGWLANRAPIRARRSPRTPTLPSFPPPRPTLPPGGPGPPRCPRARPGSTSRRAERTRPRTGPRCSWDGWAHVIARGCWVFGLGGGCERGAVQVGVGRGGAVPAPARTPAPPSSPVAAVGTLERTDHDLPKMGYGHQHQPGLALRKEGWAGAWAGRAACQRPRPPSHPSPNGLAHFGSSSCTGSPSPSPRRRRRSQRRRRRHPAVRPRRRRPARRPPGRKPPPLGQKVEGMGGSSVAGRWDWCDPAGRVGWPAVLLRRLGLAGPVTAAARPLPQALGVFQGTPRAPYARWLARSGGVECGWHPRLHGAPRPAPPRPPLPAHHQPASRMVAGIHPHTSPTQAPRRARPREASTQKSAASRP